MIKNLAGDFETVEYDEQKYSMLYDNVETEAYPVHWHNAVEIIMPLKNDYTVNVGGVDYNIHENDVLVIPPGELHSMPAIPGRRLIFQFDNRFLGDVSVLEPIMRGLNTPVLINSELNKELHIVAKKVMTEIHSLYRIKHEITDIKIYIHLIKLFMAMKEFRLEQHKILLHCDDATISEYTEKFGTVFQYIDENYMYDISLDELAYVAGYSKYHFSRIFRQYNSMSYLQYINARRTKAAEVLLLDPNMPVTEVAMRSGFMSLTTFNRVFKEIKHCTPTDFKKLYAMR